MMHSLKLQKTTLLSLAALLGLALTGFVLVWISTRWGAFLSDDSYAYIQPAREALAGRGFTPSVWFPPMLPLMLIPLGWLGLEPLAGIRLLNAVLFGVNIVLGGLLARRMGASWGFALLAAALTLFSENTLEAHAWAMSEALYITCVLVALHFLLPYFTTEGRPAMRWLLISAAAASFAGLTRLVGVVLTLTVICGILLFNPRRSWPARLRHGLIYGVVGNMLAGIYYLHNLLTIGHIHGFTTYELSPFTWDTVKWYIYSTLSWFIPGRLLREREILAALGLLLTLGAAAGFLAWRRKTLWAALWNGMPAIFWILWGFTAANYLMLIAARGVNQAAAFNERYLIPPLAMFILGGVILLDRLWRGGGRWLRRGIGLLCLVYLGYYGLRTVDLVQNLHRTGLGYANIGWHESETVPYLRAHPDLAAVATGSIGLYFWSGRLLPVITNFDNPVSLRAYLCAHDGALFIMKQMPTTIYHLDEAEVVNGLVVAQEFNDSVMYRCPAEP